jgi:Flp pilus assembly protein TadD
VELARSHQDLAGSAFCVAFEDEPVAERKNRWLLNLVLILATVGLLGVSMVPLLTSAFNNNSPQPGSGPNVAQSPEAKKAEIEAQAKGYEEVVKREPGNVTALRGLLEARLKLNDIKGAIEPLEKLAKLSPETTEYSILLAQAKQQLDDREGAAQVYRDILKTKQGDLGALSGLSDLLIKQNRPEAAIGLLQDTIKQAPTVNKTQPNSVDVTAVQVLLGKVFATQKRFDEALSVFDEAMKVNPNDFQPVVYKALVLKEQGRGDEATQLFNKASSLAPAQYKDQINQLAAAPSPGASPTAAPSGAPAPSVPVPNASPAAPAPANTAPVPKP